MSQTTNTAKEVEVDSCWTVAFDVGASNDNTVELGASYASIDDALTSVVGSLASPAARTCKCASSLSCWTVSTRCSTSVGGARGRRS